MPISRRQLFPTAVLTAGAFAHGESVRAPLRIARFVIHKVTLRWRDLLFVCDEYHSFATTGDTDPSGDERTFALSRQARLIPIVATQSISSLRSAVHLIGLPTRRLAQTSAVSSAYR